MDLTFRTNSIQTKMTLHDVLESHLSMFDIPLEEILPIKEGEPFSDTVPTTYVLWHDITSHLVLNSIMYELSKGSSARLDFITQRIAKLEEIMTFFHPLYFSEIHDSERQTMKLILAKQLTLFFSDDQSNKMLVKQPIFLQTTDSYDHRENIRLNSRKLQNILRQKENLGVFLINKIEEKYILLADFLKQKNVTSYTVYDTSQLEGLELFTHIQSELMQKPYNFKLASFILDIPAHELVRAGVLSLSSFLPQNKVRKSEA